MKHLRFICPFIMLLFSSGLWGQEEKLNHWDLLLNDIKVKYVYHDYYETYFPIVKFGKELKKLDGQQLELEGFFLPVDVTGAVLVLSYNPMSTCFFCTGSGIETIIEIDAKPELIKKFNNLKTDNFIKVRGNFKLNNENYEHLVYILNDAELIQVIK